MLIRTPTLSDIAELARVHIACWKDAYVDILPTHILDSLSQEKYEANWTRSLANNDRHNWVGEVDGQIIGFAAAGPSRDEDVPPPAMGEVYAVYLRRAHWGSGKGQALWQTVHQYLINSHFREAIVWVFEANPRARRFYERVGFKLEPDKRKMLVLHGVERPEVRYRQSLVS